MDKSRHEILFKLYRLMALRNEVREEFSEDWHYIYNMMIEDSENEIPDVVLEMIDAWMDGC